MSKKAVVSVGYFAEGLQQAHNAGLNSFAFQLIAESFGDKREAYPEGGFLIALADHQRRPVYLTVSVDPPEILEDKAE